MDFLNETFPVTPTVPLKHGGAPSIYVGGDIPIYPSKDEDLIVHTGLLFVALLTIRLVVAHAPNVLQKLRERFGDRKRRSPNLDTVYSLQGIGGWLLAFLCFAIYNHVVSFYLLVRLINQTVLYQSGLLVAYKLAAVAVLLLWVWMLTLVASGSRKFLTAATVAVCASVLLEAFRLYLGAIDSLIMIAVFIASLAYFYSSKRVANTFVT